MSNASLRDFVDRALVAQRIRFGDLRRLQRDILPAGITTQEEADALLALDQAVSKADPEWPGYLSSAVKAFVLSSSTAPAGVDTDQATWLAERLTERRTKAGQALVRQLAAEAEQGCDPLSVLTRDRRPPRPAHDEPEPDADAEATCEAVG